MLEYRGYKGRVEVDPETGIIHGEVLDIRDVVTFQGRSVDEVEDVFRESIEDYLEFRARRREDAE